MGNQKVLPDFEKPPVSEVAISVEFQRLSNWRSPHAGLFWASIASEYPNTEVQPPIPSQIEKYGDEFWQQPREPRVELVDPENTRSWFLADPPTRLVQVQHDRFIVNWRKVTGAEQYPRYAKDIRPRFVNEWHRFKKFVTEHQLGDFDVKQCEVTYVNDIGKGDAWQSFSESLKLFSPWWGKGTEGFLPPPESLNVAGSFLIPDERGRLHFAARHVIRKIDLQEAIQLRLTARGKPESSKDEDLLSWIDMGHDWIVRGFADLTSPIAHQFWQRQS